MPLPRPSRPIALACRSLGAMVALLLLLIAAPAAQAARFHPSVRAEGVRSGVATFRLSGFRADDILGGTVRWQGTSRPVSRDALRAAARRGVLRVRLDAARRALRALAAAKSTPTLVLTTSTSGPSVRFVSGPATTTSATDATFAFTVSGAKTIRCDLDGGGYTRCSSPKSYTGVMPGAHVFTVSATNSGGASAKATWSWTVAAPTPTATATPTPTPTPTSTTTTTAPTSGSKYAIRGMYGRDGSATGFDTLLSLGFTTIDSGPYADNINPLVTRGAKGIVWLGGYSNTTCSFNQSDDWVRTHVLNVAGNPGVAGYFIDDEPNAALCPTAPAQMKARSDLVKSIDPGPPTFLVDYKVDQFKLWAGTVDILGLDHYPCSIKNGCDYTKIDAQAAEADRLGIRYWGVVQAYGDDWYKVPTPDELHQEFVHWRATKMQGYLVFAWHYPSYDSTLWLANHPELQQQLAIENAS